MAVQWLGGKREQPLERPPSSGGWPGIRNPSNGDLKSPPAPIPRQREQWRQLGTAGGSPLVRCAGFSSAGENRFTWSHGVVQLIAASRLDLAPPFLDALPSPGESPHSRSGIRRAADCCGRTSHESSRRSEKPVMGGVVEGNGPIPRDGTGDREMAWGKGLPAEPWTVPIALAQIVWHAALRGARGEYMSILVPRVRSHPFPTRPQVRNRAPRF